MAPEQARAEKVLTVATDVYALGGILFACLTGKAPFRASTVEETLRQVREDPLTAPRSIVPTANRDLEAICLKCLSKDPAQRYGDAAQLADDLDRFLGGRPIKARLVPLRERLLLGVRRQPLTSALTALVVLLGVTVLAGVGWQIHRIIEQRQEDQAKLYARSASPWPADTPKRGNGLTVPTRLCKAVRPTCAAGTGPTRSASTGSPGSV